MAELNDSSRSSLRAAGHSDADINAMLADGTITVRSSGNMDSGWEAAADRWGQHADTLGQTEEAFGLQAEYSEKMARMAFGLSEEEIERGIERFPRINELARTESADTASFINEFMSEAFTKTLDDLVPDWKERIIAPGASAHDDVTSVTEAFRTRVLPEAMDAADRVSAQVLGITESQLRGEVSDDVAAQLKRRAAEVSQQIGIRGQAAKFLTARDLGKTSFELQQAGIANAPTALNLGTQAYSAFAEMLQSPIKSGINLTNLLSAYRAPTADVQSLYGSVAGIVSNTGLVPAGTVLGTTAQTLQGASQIAQSTLESFYGYNAQMSMNQQAMSLAQQNLNAQKENNMARTLQAGLGVKNGG